MAADEGWRHPPFVQTWDTTFNILVETERGRMLFATMRRDVRGIKKGDTVGKSCISMSWTLFFFSETFFFFFFSFLLLFFFPFLSHISIFFFMCIYKCEKGGRGDQRRRFHQRRSRLTDIKYHCSSSLSCYEYLGWKVVKRAINDYVCSQW